MFCSFTLLVYYCTQVKFLTLKTECTSKTKKKKKKRRKKEKKKKKSNLQKQKNTLYVLSTLTRTIYCMKKLKSYEILLIGQEDK